MELTATEFKLLATLAQRRGRVQSRDQLLRDVNGAHPEKRADDGALRARMNSFDTAHGMMREAPEVFDLNREQDRTLENYGLKRGDNQSFAWQCLIARRMLEPGVRVVEMIDNGSHDNWDSHGDMESHRPKVLRVDRAITALIGDIKARGMLDETLIAICNEFGRTPWSDGGNGKGRNHYAKAFTCLLTGAGIRGGVTYGETDEYGASIIANPCHVHDYYATILHLMGIDHERLTYHYAGPHFRLTDVAGEIIKPILA